MADRMCVNGEIIEMTPEQIAENQIRAEMAEKQEAARYLTETEQKALGFDIITGAK